MDLKKVLEKHLVEASAPCRIDAGGTLDIATFHLPLRHLSPSTVNIALDLRTRVVLEPFTTGKVKVSSTGFRSITVSAGTESFRHPLGLIFAVAAYCNAHGVHIQIDSASPPRSALGGSSVAAVAFIAALSKLAPSANRTAWSKGRIALAAHAIEAGVAGVPCGMQDQLAASYGGVNAWYWNPEGGKTPFRRVPLVTKKDYKNLEQHLLLCYCGKPHESRDINGKWVRQFLEGRYRAVWEKIISNTHRMEKAIAEKKYAAVGKAILAETELRLKMTPDVLDETGKKLFQAAKATGCGSRFSGAGGGGCLWAIGESSDIERLRCRWEEILKERKGACLLPVSIDGVGVL